MSTRTEDIETLKTVLTMLDTITPFESRARIVASVIVFYGCEQQVAKLIIQSATMMRDMAKATQS